MPSSASVLPRDARLFRAGVGLTLAAAMGSILLLPRAEALLPTCLFRELTGVDCLTCGITRSLEAASHGEILASMQFHLLGPFVLAGIVMSCIAFVAEACTGKRIVPVTPSRWWGRAVGGSAAVWIVYGVIRALVEVM